MEYIVQHGAHANVKSSWTEEISSWWIICLPLLVIALLVLFQLYILYSSLESDEEFLLVLQRRLWHVVGIASAVSLCATLLVLLITYVRVRRRNNNNAVFSKNEYVLPALTSPLTHQNVLPRNNVNSDKIPAKPDLISTQDAPPDAENADTTPSAPPLRRRSIDKPQSRTARASRAKPNGKKNKSSDDDALSSTSSSSSSSTSSASPSLSSSSSDSLSSTTIDDIPTDGFSSLLPRYEEKQSLPTNPYLQRRVRFQGI